MGLLARLFRGVINEVADDAVRTMSRDQYIETVSYTHLRRRRWGGTDQRSRIR